MPATVAAIARFSASKGCKQIVLEIASNMEGHDPSAAKAPTRCPFCCFGFLFCLKSEQTEPETHFLQKGNSAFYTVITRGNADLELQKEARNPFKNVLPQSYMETVVFCARRPPLSPFAAAEYRKVRTKAPKRESKRCDPNFVVGVLF